MGRFQKAAAAALAALGVAPAPSGAQSARACTGLDVGEIRSLDHSEVELRHPVTDAPLGAFVTLASPDHPARRQALRDIARAQRDLDAPDEEDAIAQVDETAAEFLARIVLGWRGMKENGAVLDWSPAAARTLFSRPELRWLVNQLLYEARRTENFIDASAPG